MRGEVGRLGETKGSEIRVSDKLRERK